MAQPHITQGVGGGGWDGGANYEYPPLFWNQHLPHKSNYSCKNFLNSEKTVVLYLVIFSFNKKMNAQQTMPLHKEKSY